jgi:hypothetical protein
MEHITESSEGRLPLLEHHSNQEFLEATYKVMKLCSLKTISRCLGMGTQDPRLPHVVKENHRSSSPLRTRTQMSGSHSGIHGSLKRRVVWKVEFLRIRSPLLQLKTDTMDHRRKRQKQRKREREGMMTIRPTILVMSIAKVDRGKKQKQRSQKSVDVMTIWPTMPPMPMKIVYRRKGHVQTSVFHWSS